MVLFEDEKGMEYLYSVGIQDENYADSQYLGANDGAADFREIEEYRGQKILDIFAATNHASLVLLEEDPLPNHHLLPDGSKSEGLLHFYNKNNAWHFVTQEEYLNKKNELPDICFATKHPIDSIETKTWPNLESLADEIIDKESI